MKEQTRGRTRRKVLQAIGTGALLGGVGTLPGTVSAQNILQGYVGTWDGSGVAVGGTVTVRTIHSYEQFCLDPFRSPRYWASYTHDGRTTEVYFAVQPDYHPADGFEYGDTFRIVSLERCVNFMRAEFEQVTEPSNTAPDAAFTYTPSDPEVGKEVIFNASASTDSDGSIATYEWDFGDGASTTVSTQTVAHTYTAEDDYTVTLTVTDDDGAAASASQTVAVRVFADPLVVTVAGTSIHIGPPEDLNGDGLYEDVNGDGVAKDVAGPPNPDADDVDALKVVVAAFEAGELNLNQYKVEALDFNGDGNLSVKDVNALKQSL